MPKKKDEVSVINVEGRCAEFLRTLLKTKSDSIFSFSREVVEGLAENFEAADMEISELRDQIDKLERRRIIPAPRCWYYERFHGDCSACAVNKWCRIKLSYKGSTTFDEERRDE